jgi:tRNA (cytidine/uridine-2'-O-)-methyltransferase
MNCHLHLIKPLGFSLSEKQVRRAGLDYWKSLQSTEHENFAEWERQRGLRRSFFFTTKATRSFLDVQYQPGDALVFGPETRGLSVDILEKNQDQLVTIPMTGPVRSLNLSNAVAIAIYEAYRQISRV